MKRFTTICQVLVAVCALLANVGHAVAQNAEVVVEAMPMNEIWYKSTNGTKLFLRERFGEAKVVSHTYEEGKGVIKFDKEVCTIDAFAFYRYNTLAEVSIPDGVVSIGAEAFRYCHNLKKVNFGKGVQEIKCCAFEGCVNLAKAELPKGVTTLGEKAFAESRIAALVIPAGVQCVPNQLCLGCAALKYVEIPGSVTSIGRMAFYGAAGELVIDSEVIGADNAQSPKLDPNSWLYGSKFANVTIGNSVTKIGAYAFADYATLENISISESVQSIGANALANTKVTKLILPKGVASIGHQAFLGCSGELVINSKIVEADCSLFNAPTDANIGWLSGAKFSSVIIGEEVEKIGAYTFANWSVLRKVELSDNVKAVGCNAFADSGVAKLLVGKSVSLIEYNAFKGCVNLTTILSEAVAPPQLGAEAFAGCDTACRIYVPSDSVGAYKESWGAAFGKHPHIEKSTSVY